MVLITVDKEKCKKDGTCINECPFSLLQQHEENGYPRMKPGWEHFCISCGHCVASCPHSALDHRHVPLERCLPLEEELAITRQQIWQLLRSRRSIRRFQDKPVEKEKIEKLIEVASHAPTSGNSQRLKWLVITDRNRIKTLAGLVIEWIRHELEKGAKNTGPSFLPLVVSGWENGEDTVLWNAPALLVVSAPRGTPLGMVDLTLALSYLELAAPALGLGTCWGGLLQYALYSWPPARETLGLPEKRPYFFSMMLGYPKSRYYRIPARKAPEITWE